MVGSIKLTAEWFNQIIATLKSDTKQTKGHEKRTEGRVGLRSMLDLQPLGEGGKTPKAITVWVRDISVNGIGLVSALPLTAGAELIANFARRGTTPLAVVYKVRYSRKLSSDLYSIGCNLKRVVNGDAAPKKEKPKAVAAAVAAYEGPVEG